MLLSNLVINSTFSKIAYPGIESKDCLIGTNRKNEHQHN